MHLHLVSGSGAQTHIVSTPWLVIADLFISFATIKSLFVIFQFGRVKIFSLRAAALDKRVIFGSVRAPWSSLARGCGFSADIWGSEQRNQEASRGGKRGESWSRICPNVRNKDHLKYQYFATRCLIFDVHAIALLILSKLFLYMVAVCYMHMVRLGCKNSSDIHKHDPSPALHWTESFRASQGEVFL